MSLSPEQIEIVMQLSKALHEWSIDPKLEREGLESKYFGSSIRCTRTGGMIPTGTQNEFDGSDRSLYVTVYEYLLDLDFKVANELEMKVEELRRRAIQVDLRKKSPDYVKDYAAKIAQELEDIAKGSLDISFENSKKNETTFPKNKMALTVIPSVFDVSARTLYRRIKDGTFISYLDDKGKIFLDTVAVAERYKHLK